jgi:translation initiation factor IF-2
MAKTVINLVKELGVKSTAEVLDLLRRVGVDTDAEGFGVMSKVDDQTIAKLHAHLANGDSSVAEAPATTKPARKRRPAAEEEEPLDIDKQARKPRRRTIKKDFFGPKTKEKPAEPEPTDKEAAPEEPESREKEKEKAKGKDKKEEKEKAKPERKSKTGIKKDARTKQSDKLDLSSGPRIISMPDPVEQSRLKERQAAPGSPGDAQPAGKRKRKKGRQAAEQRQGGMGRRTRKDMIDQENEEKLVRSRKRVFKVAGQKQADKPQVVPHIKITGPMPMREVAKATGIRVPELVRFLMSDLGIMANINYTVSVDELQLVAENFGIKYTVQLEQEAEHELEAFENIDKDKLITRPPVVTVMGHVDHGKTKLLDTIRMANVVADEAGGITQHIGAYQAEKKGKHITFIDTPGHEAFTAMRARGSQVTDIVILVVAADDGVMPQTIEAIDHARAAEVPLIVAINKCDKPDSNPDRVTTQLAERGLTPEEWGGDTVFVKISALKGEGIDELLEMILLTAELVDPQADPHSPPYGVVVESQVDTGIGVVATVLVQQGEMAKGQFLLSGTTIGRIKRMEDYRGQEVEVAGPSMPVRIIGFNDPPENGEKVYTFKNKKQAQAIVDQRIAKQRNTAAAGASGRMTLEAFFQKAEEGEVMTLNLVVKADVGGSAEALVDQIKKIDIEGTECNVVSSGVGQITESDVNLAAASDAVIIGFGVPVAPTAKKLAEREHVDVRTYNIIYEVTEDIELALKGRLAPEYEQRSLGRLEVRAIFKQERNSTVAGGYVLDGIARRGAKFNIYRGKEKVHENMTLNSLKRFKDDVREVASGYECGLLLDSGDIEEGDILELYEIVEVERQF